MSGRGARLVVERRGAILVLAALATAASLRFAGALRVDSGLDAIFPRGDPVLTRLRYVMENFGGDFLVAVVRDKSRVDEVEQRLRDLPEILSVDRAPLSALPAKKRGQSGIAAILLATPAKPPTDGEFCRVVAAKAKALAAALPVEFTGPHVLLPEHQARVRRDMGRSSAIALAAVMGIVGFYFRGQWRRIALVGVSLVAGLLWTLAFVRVAFGHLNLATAAFPPMLLGIGVDYSIHVLSFFQEAEGEGGPRWEPVQRLYQTLGYPLLTCACSTGLALFALTRAELRGFVEMGAMGGVGVLMELIAALVLLPALLSTRWGVRPHAPKQRPPMLVRAAMAWAGKPGRALMASLAVVLALGYFARRIGYETDPRQMQDPTQPSIRLQDQLVRDLGLSFSALVAVSDTRAEEAELDDYCRARHVGRGLTFGYMDSLSKRLASNLPIPRLRVFVGRDRKLAAYLFPRGQVYNEDNLAGIVAAAGDIRRNTPARMLVGSPLLYDHMLQTLKRDLRRSLSFSVAGVAVLLLILFRHLRRAALALCPAALGLVCMLGGMRLMGLNFSLINAVATPLVIGLGVDDGICLLSRLVHDKADIRSALASTGRACWLTSLTTIAAFASLLISPNRGFVSMGLSAMVGIAACLMLTLFLLPALTRIAGLKA